MNVKHFTSLGAQTARTGLLTLAIAQLAVGNSFAAALPQADDSRDYDTATPIKHVIVIIGENRSFDHVFATYVPKNGQKVWNLLSEGIVKADGTPGPNFAKAQQKAATDAAPDAFLLNPPKTSFPGDVLPAPLVGGPKTSYISPATLPNAEASENGLPGDYYQYLLSGGTGQSSYVPDARIPDVNALPPGPFQLTSKTLPYDGYAASPVHRFYQMWQQLDCDLSHATAKNPSGCDAALFPWVEVTIGAGDNGIEQPANFSTEYGVGLTTTGEGSTSMAFYNMHQGDAPYFKSLADTYSISDNFHQSVNGGTGANHIMFGHADAIYFTDRDGKPAAPPENKTVFTKDYNGAANPDQGVVNEIENPNPQVGTNNFWVEDGYGEDYNEGYPPPYTASPVYGGGSYSECTNPDNPGVGPVLSYLKSVHIDPRCEAGRYYLLNNYNPGYFGNGKNAYVDQNPANTPFTIPPSSTRSIGDELSKSHVSWTYYGDQWNNYVPDPYQLNWDNTGPTMDEYCNICNPFQYDKSIMSHPDQIAAHIQDTANLYTNIALGTLPAVSIVKPSGLVDGHPNSSKLDLFEGFVKKIVDAVHANPKLWNDTAIFITFDEGGGYYDSGYVQPVDFFGDGTRIPLIVVSKYSTGGHIAHDYGDHVSIIKFIERNWGTDTITKRSRDNFPNPVTRWDNPYVPVNGPALDDLFSLFHF
jgi:phospholipase C